MEFHAINPKSGEKLEGVFKNATENEIHTVVENAEKAFVQYRKVGSNQKADFLDQIATEINNLGDDLIQRCHLETMLPEGRLIGERGRTMNQLRLFAEILREGSWVDARIDTALPDRQPIPRPDLRHMLKPLGPVAVFGASNFPLAFSAAGGDTASALAAGCSVVVKGHPAHPGTTELIYKAITKAIQVTNMPEHVFSLIQGNTIEVGQSLILNPAIKAVGFTGSYRGGKAIFDAANKRKEPIPVFAEMGSTNPVFILPEALKEKGTQIAKGLAGSINLGVGQFCTNPGLIFLDSNNNASDFKLQLKSSISEIEQAPMLTPSIKDAYNSGLKNYEKDEGLQSIAQSKETVSGVVSKVYETNVEHFLAKKSLEEENFGPSSILISGNSKEALVKAAQNLDGHLTATVHGTDDDLNNYKDLLDVLEQKVGRIIINGYPTGVEVCHAMVHGGPFPSTTAPQSTSVGTNAIKRFVRPVCLQDYPQSLLPEELKDNNPLNIWRLVNGELSKNTL